MSLSFDESPFKKKKKKRIEITFLANFKQAEINSGSQVYFYFGGRNPSFILSTFYPLGKS